MLCASCYTLVAVEESHQDDAKRVELAARLSRLAPMVPTHPNRSECRVGKQPHKYRSGLRRVDGVRDVTVMGLSLLSHDFDNWYSGTSDVLAESGLVATGLEMLPPAEYVARLSVYNLYDVDRRVCDYETTAPNA